MIYRVYFSDDVNRTHQVADKASCRFEALTIIETTGYWRGAKEYGVIVELIDPDNEPGFAHSVEQFARNLKYEFNQECVLIAKIQADVDFV